MGVCCERVLIEDVLSVNIERVHTNKMKWMNDERFGQCVTTYRIQHLIVVVVVRISFER